MKRFAMGIPVVLFMMAVALISVSGHAYNAYTNTNCSSSSCHSGFQSRGPLHDLHLTFISNCGMCHPNNPGSTPVSTFMANDPTAYSCLGCHGRDYGGSTGMQSAGLRTFHFDQRGVTVCAGCHPSDPTPFGENVNPVHYGRADVSLTNACNDNLDNDGDGVRDANDPDCQVPVETSTWGGVKALYRSE